jgi:hypothetical protein
MNVLAEGKWCGSCDFFEYLDEEDEGQCRSCGCPHSAHASAQVIES